MLTLNDGRSELWQWDTGRKLTVDADCTQVHFSNKFFGRSVDVDVFDGTAAIPDVLLQVDNELIAWAFVGTPENGYTKISKVFKVNKRNKPADYVFTPHEQTTLEEIKEKIEYLESIQDPDAIKNAVEDYLEQNPVEAPVQSVNGKTGKVDLTAEDVGAISQDKLQEATNEALAQAKASGEFDGSDGKDGYTPQKGVDYFDGQPGRDGVDGKDYVLTDADKAEIAEQAAELVEVPDSGGNVDLTGYATEDYVQEYAQPKGEYLTEVPDGYAKTEDIPTDAEIIQLINDNSPEPSGGGIAVTGAKVGQTVKIAEVDENGVPTAWLPTDFPSGGSGGGTPFKLLASAEPITEPVRRIEVSITEDGIAEIYLVGKAKQAEANSYSYAYVGVNGKSASYNTKITESYESFVLYHGVLLDGGHFLGELSIEQHADKPSLGAMKIPQNGFDGFQEQVKTVTLSHSGSGLLAIGTYFDVWGR